MVFLILRRLRVVRYNGGYVTQIRVRLTWYSVDLTNRYMVYPQPLVPIECVASTPFIAYKCLASIKLELIEEQREREMYND